MEAISLHYNLGPAIRAFVAYWERGSSTSNKPYAREEAVQLELESVAFTDPLFKNKKASDFMDSSIVAELDRKGFFAQLQ